MDSKTQSINTRDVFEWNPHNDTFKQVGNSHVLEDIQKQRAWDDEELAHQLNIRREVLKYMIDNDITDYEVVTDIIRSFILDVDGVYELLEEDRLEEVTKQFSDTDTLVERAIENNEEITENELVDPFITADAHEDSDDELPGEPVDEDIVFDEEDPSQSPVDSSGEEGESASDSVDDGDIDDE